MPSSRFRSLSLVTLFIFFVAGLSFAEESDEKSTLSVDSWLLLEATPVALPAFRDGDDGAAEILDELKLAPSDLWPAAGREAHWPPGKASVWRSEKASDGKITLDAPKGNAAAWLATTLTTQRFLDASLTLESAGLLQVWVDGEKITSKKEAGEEVDDVDATLALDTGSHRILVLAVRPAASEAAWTVGASLEMGTEIAGAVSFSADAERGVAIDDLLEPTRAQSVDVSPGGHHVAISMQRPSAPSQGGESWIEIVSTSGEVLRTLGDRPSSFAWSPAADGSFAYMAAVGEKSQVRLGKVADGQTRIIARDLENVSNLRFVNAETLLLTTLESAEADERGVKRFRDAMDRWSYRRDRQHHHLLGLDGSMRRLTVSDPFDELQDVHPQGTHLLIARAHYAGARRPFRRTELIELDLETLEPRTVADLGWFNSAIYAPDGRHALVFGSAELFDGAGKTLAADRLANDYDAQAYWLDLENGQATALSRDFDPSIQSARWPDGDRAYLRVEDRSWQRLVTLDPKTQTYEVVPSGVDAVHSFDVEGGRLAWVGSSMNGPHAVWTSTGGEPSLLLETSADRFKDVNFGEVRDWSFTSKAGDEILGRVYLPPGVDESAAGAYPMIVYYYGGTAPVGRSFGGRYPKELWAAQGYVVYVLQPSGTTGFGQEFAARHVNAWGRMTADEILEGTERFVDAHPFVDRGRIGAIGASYGGFMTMYLQTRSDIFAAAISHAGISNLASYWGQGWWGYLYSDAASAGSFPWNNKDLYVEQSPIYAADKIQTPLLLLHGDADTNVPPVESHQMYTALEVLGKEVELIEIGGQNHTIRSFKERRLWSRTILAWFDRYLKEQPEMWDHLWGSEEKPKG